MEAASMNEKSEGKGTTVNSITESGKCAKECSAYQTALGLEINSANVPKNAGKAPGTTPTAQSGGGKW